MQSVKASCLESAFSTAPYEATLQGFGQVCIGKHRQIIKFPSCFGANDC